MISKRFVLCFDTCEVQSKRHVKRFLCFVLLCVCVCVHTPLCEKKKTSPEGYPFVLITLMKLVERDGQRAFLYERSECFRL